MKKYRVKWQEINEYEVVKETPKQIVFLEPGWNDKTTFKESREAKKSGYQNWFDTWEQAHDFLVEASKRKIKGLESRIKSEKKVLSNILNMDKP